MKSFYHFRGMEILIGFFLSHNDDDYEGSRAYDNLSECDKLLILPLQFF
jgi:hypothetical protein